MKKNIIKRYLYNKLLDLSEYHYDLFPKKNDGLDRLMQTYFFWGDKYNDEYIPEERCDEDDRLSMYLLQEFEKFLETPVSIRY